MSTRRAIRAAGCGGFVVAGVLAVAAFNAATADVSESAAVPVTAAALPSTVPPLRSDQPRDVRAAPTTSVATSVPATTTPVAAPVPPVSTTTLVPTTTTAPPTTLPRSPLADLVGDAVSAIPEPVTARVAPTRLTIGTIGVDTPVRDVGISPDGQLEIPDETEVGWYRLGAAPGEPGAVVLAGHVSWNGALGPFSRLGEVEPGTRVELDLADGGRRAYEVVERNQYGKLMLPAERIWTRDGPETLVLITCGGAFNPELRRYADNIVVFAVAVA